MQKTMNRISFKITCIILRILSVFFILALMPAQVFAGWVSEDLQLYEKTLTQCSDRSLAIDNNTGIIHVVYGGDVLKHTDFDGISWQYETVDSTVSVGCPSITIDTNGKVHISYDDKTNGGLKYATNASGSWSIMTLDSSGSTGDYNSIAIDSNNKVHISYYDWANKDLKYITNVSGSWVASVLDSTDEVGANNSIDIDSNDKVHISYDYKTGYDLRYITNKSGSWLVSIIDDSIRATESSIAIDSADKVHISYYNSQNYDLKYSTDSSGSWVRSVIDSVGLVGRFSSISADGNGKIHISYNDSTNGNLKYATDSSGSWNFDTIDTGNIRGSSIAIDSANNVFVAYDINWGIIRLAANNLGVWYVSEVDRAVRYSSQRPCLDTTPNGKTFIVKPTLQADLGYATNESGSWVSGLIEGVSNPTDCYVAVDSGNKLHISYTDGSTSEVKYVSNASGVWAIDTIESGTAGPISIDLNDKAHMIYSSSGNVKYANNTSGSWTSEVIDSGEAPVTIRIDSNDKAHVVFINTVVNIGVFYATNESGAWNSTYVHNDPDFSQFKIDSVNKVHAATYRSSGREIIYATNASGTWVEETASDIYDPFGALDYNAAYIQLSLDSSNKAHILYSYALTDAGTGGTVSDLVYATNVYGYWFDETGLPGDIGVCNFYVFKCVSYSLYPFSMVMDSNENLYYVVRDDF